MVKTPWGDSEKLRDQKLPPGRGTPAKEVRENQRRRLFGGLVAAVEERGYEDTRVADVLRISGVSRKAFYEHFANKAECFLAATESLIQPTIAAVRTSDQPAGEQQAQQGFEAFVRLVASQPAAARLCFVELYAAGPETVAVADRALDAFGELTRSWYSAMPGREEMPLGISRSIVNGLRKLIHRRLYRHEEDQLVGLVGQMWDWAMSYYPPPERLRRPRGRRRADPHPLESFEQPERTLRALAAVVAENGYPATRVADIAERASISHSTFYEHFEGKEEAMRAALDSGSSQMLAAMLPAFRRASDWPSSIRLTYESMFAWAAAEPDYAQLGALDVYAAGRRALEQRDQVMEGLETLLKPGYQLAPDTSPLAGEAIGGAVYGLIYDQVKASGPASLPQIGPLATYITLAPFLGPKEACKVANAGRRR
jgi:AcrR family transcriptional regulator